MDSCREPNCRVRNELCELWLQSPKAHQLTHLGWAETTFPPRHQLTAAVSSVESRADLRSEYKTIGVLAEGEIARAAARLTRSEDDKARRAQGTH